MTILVDNKYFNLATTLHGICVYISIPSKSRYIYVYAFCLISLHYMDKFIIYDFITLTIQLEQVLLSETQLCIAIWIKYALSYYTGQFFAIFKHTWIYENVQVWTN